MPNRRTVKMNCQTGLDFIQFLENSDKADVKDKAEMKEIYLQNYRPTLETSCSFGSIIYALRAYGKIKPSKNRVTVLQRCFVAVDQHRTLRKSSSSANGSQQHEFSCASCNIHCNSAVNLEEHLNGNKHKQQLIYKSIKEGWPSLVKNKHGMDVSSTYDRQKGSITCKLEQGNSFKFSITIKNGSTDDISFRSAVLMKEQPSIVLSDKYNILKSKRVVKFTPGDEYHIDVEIKGDNVGFMSSPVMLAFEHSESDEVFHIVRFLTIEVTNSIADDLPPVVPYCPPPRVSRRLHISEIIDGVRLPSSAVAKLKMKTLEKYPIPGDLRRKLNDKAYVDEISQSIRPDLAWPNYKLKLSTLLHIEECQMEVDIQRYSMKAVTMTKDGQFLKLNVPGLAENRPSVLKGDHLLARVSADPVKSKAYRGYVHQVEMEELSLGFDKKLLERYISGMKFDIEFTFNRIPLRFQHEAIARATTTNIEHMLFPSTPKLHSIPNNTLPPKLFDSKLANNSEQLKAISHILAGSSRPAPYLIFGPPGTGKTVTMVEAIKQIHNTTTTSHILACAPSNSAADLLATRILSGQGPPISKASLMRMNAQSREWITVAQLLKEKDVCNYDKKTRITSFPAKEELMTKRILVTTLCTAGRLGAADFPQDHFTHVFIDEAGHAVEPEAIIPLAGLLKNSPGSQVVLAGDPEQLGPIVRSPLALRYGLGHSLLWRLMTACKAYRRQDSEPHYNSQILTKLLKNYRSHPDILKLPNEMFYKNELEVHADKLVRDSLCNWEKLPNQKFPIIFHGIEGKDEREAQSPSFFNAAEVSVVVQYVEELLSKKGGKKIRMEDIGVISPYRRQVQKLQKVLKKRHLADIKVGSVEEFQGQERLVIIISTVRSTNPDKIQMDIDYRLGFLQSPKRFNVAITRAKALLVVVGNPYLLHMDDHWDQFLEYSRKNRAYTGCHYETSDNEMNDIMQQLEDMKISNLVYEQGQ